MFHIRSGIPGRIVTVQITGDIQNPLDFTVIGPNPTAVNLHFARVLVSGAGINQPAVIPGADGMNLLVTMQGNDVVIG